MRVVSDEYSNPSFRILNSLSLPILLVFGLIIALLPREVDVPVDNPLIVGSFL